MRNGGRSSLVHSTAFPLRLFALLALASCGGASEPVRTPETHATGASSGKPVIAADVRVGGAHACALTPEGKVLCWGSNAHGELGDGTTTSHPTATEVPGLPAAKAIALGDAHTCVLLVDETVRCFGTNEHGELGTGQSASSTKPIAVPELAEVKSLSAGGAQTCAVKGDGVTLCWGDRNGSPVRTPLPVFGLAQATAVAVGPHHACAVVAPDGQVRCWGDNALRQLGVPRVADRGLPSEVKDLSGVKELRAGRDATCALTSTGAAMCWGGGLSCVPGAYAEGRVVAVKPAAVEGLEHLTSVAAGGDRACGVEESGSVACVKPHGAGEGAEHMCVREAMPSLGHVAKLALADDFGCMIDGATKAVACWGSNAGGQLGDGTTTAHATPAPVRR